MSDHQLTAQCVTIIRDERRLVENFSFSIYPGQNIWIKGRNGSGKTTLLKVLVGLRQADHGEVSWCGIPIQKNRKNYAEKLLYLGHTPAIKNELTPLENLQFYSRLRGLQVDRKRDKQVLSSLGLSGFSEQPVNTLSAGQCRRVALARLKIEPTTLWVLDEPLTALDAQGVDWLKEQLQLHCRQGGMVVFTSHQSIFFNTIETEVLSLDGAGS